MSDVLVLGAGLCGLSTAMLLARDGHQVTVLERDPQEPPSTINDAWEDWERKGVAQFRQPHGLHPRFRMEADTYLPELVSALDRAGGGWFHTLSAWPPMLEDRSEREGDDRFWAITGRRPFLDAVFSRTAAEHARVEVIRGVNIAGLLSEERNGIPHVTGVRTARGKEHKADLVIDAMGRRSQLPAWIEAIGGRPPFEEAEDCGFIYYTRFFRSSHGMLPELLGRNLTPMGTFSILTLYADNGTHSVTLFVSTGDQAVKKLRHADVWSRVVAACPLQAHWLDGKPISDINAMSGIADRYRRFVIDGTPCATGIVPVADARMCTNPSLGRGISLGLMHAVRLRDVLREHHTDPAEFARRFDEVTELELRPWYDAQVVMDRARWAEIECLREGRVPPASNDPQLKLSRGLFNAGATDPDAFRGVLDIIGCIATPQQVLTRPGMMDRVIEAAEGPGLPPAPGPTREQLLELVDA